MLGRTPGAQGRIGPGNAVGPGNVQILVCNSEVDQLPGGPAGEETQNYPSERPSVRW